MKRFLRSPLGWFGIVIVSGLAVLAVGSLEAGSDASPSPATSDNAKPAESAKKDETSARKPAGDEELQADDSNMPEMAALEDVRKRRQELDAREQAVKAREAELKAKEQALNEELKKISAVRDDISKIDEGRKKENEEKVEKLVQTFETMSPKSAAQVFATLDDSLAIAAMAKMATVKLAKILNVMEPQRSSKLTELMAGVVRARQPASSNGAAATTKVTKGGENKYDVNQDQQSGQ